MIAFPSSSLLIDRGERGVGNMPSVLDMFGIKDQLRSLLRKRFYFVSSSTSRAEVQDERSLIS
jgi:hypothetical protein